MSNVSIGVLSRNYGALVLFVRSVCATHVSSPSPPPLPLANASGGNTASAERVSGSTVALSGILMRTRGNQKSDLRPSDPAFNGAKSAAKTTAASQLRLQQ